MFIIIENDKLAVKLSTFAGGIESIISKATGNDHYWHYDSAVWPRRTPVCFPICGGLTDGEYTYERKLYNLPIHGFLRETELTVEQQSGDMLVMSTASNDKTREIYPFDFRFELDQRLEGDKFVVKYIVTNIGAGNMYFSTGSHYTYAMPIVPGEKQKDYRYAFGKPQKAGKLLLEGAAVSGKTDDIFKGKEGIDLDGLFENGATILEIADIDPKYIAIESKNTGAYTKVEFDGFDYCVLWAPKGESPFVCIEPWSGMLDQVGHDKDITKKLGITKLSAGEKRVYTQIITVK